MGDEVENTIEIRITEPTPVQEKSPLERENELMKQELMAIEKHLEASRQIEAENAALKKDFEKATRRLRMENEALKEALKSRPPESEARSIVLSAERPGPRARVADEVRRTFASTAPTKGKIVTFREVCDILNQNYNYEESIKSTTLDIISVYLKGQKVLYIEAKTYCEQQLYALMLPTIAITALCSVISVVLKDLAWGAVLVSGLTATNTFVLSLITYLKLDAKAEAHKTSAYSYESLQASCEFSSGKILLKGLADVGDDLSTTAEELIAAKKTHEDLMNMIEVRVKEIKDSNKFVLPEVIRYKYPVTYGTNVFSEVKKLQNQEIILVNKLKVIVNRIYKLEDEEGKMKPLIYKQQLDDLNAEQDAALDEIIKYRNTYLEIDGAFKSEIDANVAAARRTCGLCRWLKT